MPSTGMPTISPSQGVAVSVSGRISLTLMSPLSNSDASASGNNNLMISAAAYSAPAASRKMLPTMQIPEK